MTIPYAYPTGTRVIVPGGIRGTVIRVSRALRKAPILVQLDTGAAKAYAPEQLTRIVAPVLQPYP